MEANDEGRKARASTARGLAVLAVAASLVVVVRSFASSDAPGHGMGSDVCARPVEILTELGLRLGCATEEIVSSCTDVQAGDRLVGLEHGCRVEPGGMSAATRLLVGLPLDINRASDADLRLLDGIGPKLSEAIVQDRERHGAFRRVGDLVRIKGIGPATLEKLRPYVSVGGP